jgi:hypothetical protein
MSASDLVVAEARCAHLVLGCGEFPLTTSLSQSLVLGVAGGCQGSLNLVTQPADRVSHRSSSPCLSLKCFVLSLLLDVALPLTMAFVHRVGLHEQGL